jgi:hypothetical protein
LGLAALAVPAYTAFRKSRPDDPGGVIPYAEGLTTSHVSRDARVSAEDTAETVEAWGAGPDDDHGR